MNNKYMSFMFLIVFSAILAIFTVGGEISKITNVFDGMITIGFIYLFMNIVDECLNVKALVQNKKLKSIIEGTYQITTVLVIAYPLLIVFGYEIYTLQIPAMIWVITVIIDLLYATIKEKQGFD